MSVNQNVPTCAPSGTNNGCRPNPNYANNSQYSSVGESTYHGLHVSFVQRPARWGHYRVSYTLSKSMNNVGEFFFSSPIDPLDLSKDWGRSDDDQRHRLVMHGAVRSSTEPATDLWERISHGFRVERHGAGVLGAAVQHHVRRDHRFKALPAGRSSTARSSNGTPGIGSDFFSLNARVSRTFRLTGRLELRGAGRRLQPHEPHERPHAEHQLRHGAVSDEPVADVRTDHGRRRTPVVPVRIAGQVLKASR